ncbi:MAG: metal-dependent transcriptional regulator [Ignavibacteria bacterium]|nr:metal-dependent transcriptional regulator [Ignavibacteria bacterium]
MPNISKEDYLRVIYKNYTEGSLVTATVIAEKLKVSNAAVTDMLKKLSRAKFVNYIPYKGVELLPKGMETAVNLVRRHRIWETYLYKIVGLPLSLVDSEAENLEHSSSDELIDRLEEILGFPEFDPHGDPIPSKKGKIPKLKKNVALSELQIDECGSIARVSDDSTELLDHFSKLGIELAMEVKVIEKRSFDNSMLIRVKRKNHNISEKFAQNIFIELKQ